MKKTTTLIPMTEFVLSLPPDYNYKEIARLSVYYARFLKQPLQEWMFVGEDALFPFESNKDSYKYHVGRKRNVEYFTAFPNVELTPKALEQIYGGI